MPAFELHSEWKLDAAPAAVWQALTRVEDWPRWWPYVEAVEVLRPGRGVGALRRMHWRTRLPYRLSLLMLCTAAERERRLLGRASGHLQGEGEWRLEPEGDGSRLHYRWSVDVARPWMRASLALLAPLFAWNHRAVMAAGERGLRDWLARWPTGMPEAASAAPAPAGPAGFGA